MVSIYTVQELQEEDNKTMLNSSPMSILGRLVERHSVKNQKRGVIISIRYCH